jgi:uncharacterized phage protein (TIGR02218 family)
VKTLPAPLLAILYNYSGHTPADCWTFEFADATKRWTNFTAPLTVGADTWTIGPGLERPEDVTSGIGIEVDDLHLTIRVGAESAGITVGGLGLIASVSRGLWRGVRVTFQRAYMLTPGDASAGLVTEFVGYIEDAKPSATGIRLTIKSLASRLMVPLPRRMIMSQCTYRLGSTECGVNLATYTDARTAAAGSTRSLVKLNATSTRAVPGGLVVIAGESRMVRSVSGVDLSLTVPLSVAPATGASIQVILGCDKTRPTCKNVFNNLLRYGGFPDAPKGEVV